MSYRRIVEFYGGGGVDDRGRKLDDILAWPDERIESVHDFIQWLFPLREPSPVNPGAPVLDRETIAEFRARPELREKLRTSFERMLRFYGLEWQAPKVVQTRAANWLSPGNHNHLRMTRIIKCLRLLGLETEAKAFYECLDGISSKAGAGLITAETLRFWRDAALGS